MGCCDGFGGAEGNRTPGLVIANDALYQLSYGPIAYFSEPALSACQAGPNAAEVASAAGGGVTKADDIGRGPCACLTGDLAAIAKDKQGGDAADIPTR